MEMVPSWQWVILEQSTHLQMEALGLSRLPEQQTLSKTLHMQMIPSYRSVIQEQFSHQRMESHGLQELLELQIL